MSCARNSAQQYYHFSRIPKVYTKINLNHYDLAYLIDLFSSIQFGLEHRGKDIFGRIYEYFLGKFTEAECKKEANFILQDASQSLLLKFSMLKVEEF